MKRFLYRFADKADALPLQFNPYLEKAVLKHHKAFCCSAGLLSLICLSVGIISFVCGIEVWFVLLFLIAGVLGLVSTAYLAFVKCVVDQEKIEKRAVIRLKRVFWRDVTLIREVNQKRIGKQILLVYGKESLLIDFESPAKGMDALLNLAKQKGVQIQRYTDVSLYKILKMDVAE